MKIRALIVDDERLARANLQVLAEAQPGVEVVGCCADGLAAADVIATQQPDVVFLDVRMPKLDGIALLENLRAAGDASDASEGPHAKDSASGTNHAPLIVFVTAHDRYALRAFDEGAVDYLLKPFDDERFAAMMERVRERLYIRDFASPTNVIEKLVANERYPKRILVKGTGRTTVVQVDEIDWIGGAGNYVRFHLGDRRVLHRATISDTLSRLDPAVFTRIHRSTIVNVTQIRQLEPIAKGAWSIRLANGTELRLTSAFRDALEARLLGA